MIEKLLNIKTILKIIICVLIIFSMAKSCAKAYTLEEVYDLAQSLKSISITKTSYQNTAINNFISDFNTIKTKVTDSNFDYTSIIITNNGSTTFVYLFNENETFSTGGIESNRRIYFNGSNGTSFYKSLNYQQVAVGSTSYIELKEAFGLVNTTVNLNLSTSGGYNILLNNVYNSINIFTNLDLKTSNLPWYIGDGRIGSFYTDSNLKFFLHNKNDNTIYKELISDELQGTNGLLYQLRVPNVIDLINDDIYYVSIQTSGDNSSYYNSIDFTLSWSDDYIPTPPTSGDTSSNIDLTETNNIIKDLPNNIGNTFYNSGDSGEKGIIQKVYDDLFTISEDKLNSKLSDFINDNALDSGEAQIAMLGFNYLNNSGDFIISWNNLNTPYFKLSGDKINFSAMVRNNQGLNIVMKYVHHILGLSLLILLGSNYFKTLLVTLGIGTEIYEHNFQEVQPVESVSITTDKKGNKKVTRTLKTGNITQRWVR